MPSLWLFFLILPLVCFVMFIKNWKDYEGHPIPTNASLVFPFICIQFQSEDNVAMCSDGEIFRMGFGTFPPANSTVHFDPFTFYGTWHNPFTFRQTEMWQGIYLKVQVKQCGSVHESTCSLVDEYETRYQVMSGMKHTITEMHDRPYGRPTRTNVSITVTCLDHFCGPYCDTYCAPTTTTHLFTSSPTTSSTTSLSTTHTNLTTTRPFTSTSTPATTTSSSTTPTDSTTTHLFTSTLSSTPTASPSKTPLHSTTTHPFTSTPTPTPTTVPATTPTYSTTTSITSPTVPTSFASTPGPSTTTSQPLTASSTSIPAPPVLHSTRTCSNIWGEGERRSGVYHLRAAHPGDKTHVRHFTAFCDMETDGGGWTLIQRRENGLVEFNRNWVEYKGGFGNVTAEHWLGLENIFWLALAQRSVLRIDLWDCRINETRFVLYSSFALGSESSHYRLNVGEAVGGNAKDAFRGHSNLNQSRSHFSTPDRDYDNAPIHCARAMKGGWWFNGCGSCNLNGHYYHYPGCFYTSPQRDGVFWTFGDETDTRSLPWTEMKVRAQSFVSTP